MMTAKILQNGQGYLGSLLAELVEVAPGYDYAGIKYARLCMDSREICAGDVFLAVSGLQQNAADYINMALERGAVAVIHESPVSDVLQELAKRRNVPLIQDSALKEHIGVYASRFYNHPSHQIKVVAVTGTDGKTSVSHFIAQSLQNMPTAKPQSSGVIGTLGNGIYGKIKPGTHTTPDALTVQALLAEMRAQNVKYVAMEASSHGLEQGRLNGLDIEVAVLTNFGRDHLDYHLDLVAYRMAKARLFAHPSLQSAVLNVQDEFGQALWETHRQDYPITVYGLGDIDFDLGKVDDWVWGRIKSYSRRGFVLSLSLPDDGFEIEVPLLGGFNAKNILAVVAVLKRLGFESNMIAQSISALQPVPGRMQLIEQAGHPAVVVDYAHTPQALESALQELRNHFSGRLYCVFGCGGNRDAGKRPLMGGIAERCADSVIVTDDNPRHESAQAIVSDILAGCRDPGAIRIIHDRREAIVAAIADAKPEDVVLLAGKGHETDQQIGSEKKIFSDQAAVYKAMGMEGLHVIQ